MLREPGNRSQGEPVPPAALGWAQTCQGAKLHLKVLNSIQANTSLDKLDPGQGEVTDGKMQ